MTYKSKLQSLAARLHDGPLSFFERRSMGTLLARHAERIGDLEECADYAGDLAGQQIAALDVAHRVRTATEAAARTIDRLGRATPTETTMLLADLRGYTLTVQAQMDRLHPVCADAVPEKKLPACLLVAARGAL